MTRSIPDPIAAPGASATAPSKRRRGTVLLFALGVLAVISVAALSYVTFVRVDRQASSAVSRTVLFDRQVSRVVEEHQALIAADLFENKIVTSDVPRDFLPNGTDDPIWPTMFGDGEFRDYAWQNNATFNLDLPGKKDNSTVDNSVLALDQVPPADDAWLASFDPMWFQPGTNNDRTHWRQITNLRSGYRYDDNGTPKNLNDDRWIRGDGKFVDLGQFFLDFNTVGTTKRGNPGTNLLDKSIFGTSSVDGAVMPRFAAGNYALAPYVPMHFMDKYPAAPSTGNPQLTARDERFWADTDGDLRPDARWQLIDSLGTAEGLIWVSASRIIDLSAMVNVNSAIEGGFPSASAEDYAEGRTPADVDLYRLLKNDIAGENLIPPGRQWNNLLSRSQKLSEDDGTFDRHLRERLKIIELTEILDDPDPATPLAGVEFPLASNFDWRELNGNRRLKPDHRRAFWNAVGSSPGRGPALSTPRGPIQPGYSLDGMIDLHAFMGSNNRSILSELEEIIDGPDNTFGFLPRPTDDGTQDIGPLRSRERPGDVRYPGSVMAGTGPDATHPLPQEVRVDPRRLITMVSGVADFSPVPVLNNKAKLWNEQRPYAGKYLNTKIRLLNCADAALIPDTFQSFVWALAPLATDEFLTGYNHANIGALVGDYINADRLIDGGLAGNPSYHYGGEDYAAGPSPARDLADPLRTLAVQYGVTSGASFAVHTAGALSLNLKDSSDTDDVPTVARLLVSNDNDRPLRSRALGADKVILGTRFSQGDVPREMLDVNSTGLRSTQTEAFERAADLGDTAVMEAWLSGPGRGAGTGLTLVGLERHPYITEVFGFALFENVGGANDAILATDTGAQVGAVLAVELANPYKSELTIGPEYEITILQPGKDDMALTMLDAPLRLKVPAAMVIPAESRMTFLYTHYDPTKMGFESTLGINAGDTNGDVVSAAAGVADRYISDAAMTPATGERKLVLVPVSQDLVDANPVFLMPFAGQPLRVALRRELAALAAPGALDPAFAVVDYMESADAFFGGGALDLVSPMALRTFFPKTYFEQIGYVFNPPLATVLVNDRFNAGAINGRIGFTSSISRPINRTDFGGFPRYIAATRPADTFRVDTSVADVFGQAWLIPIDGAPGEAPAVQGDNGLNPDKLLTFAFGLKPGSLLENFHDFEVVSDGPKAADANAGSVPDRNAAAGGWQLFVPNRPLGYVSELHQLCTYAHMCRDDQITNIGAWTTVGMQVRESLTWNYAKATASNDNPYLGTLDPSRYMPSGSMFFGEGGYPRDDALAIPLALRVFDCFEALSPAGALAQGRININTAPERVLQVLPLMAPSDSTLGSLTPTNSRVELMLQYRDAWDPNNGLSFPTYNPGTILRLGQNLFAGSVANGDAIVRRTGLSHNEDLVGVNNAYPYTKGFATAGELAILEEWSGNGLINDFPGSLLNGFIFPLGYNGADEDFDAITRRIYHGDSEASLEFDGITDDPKERLALFRAVSNIVSSRSDVFGAWFILRGYDPKQIETIEVDTSIGTQEEWLTKAMQDERFLPVYETRWFVIYDRSNCRTPTDRPRVLLKAQLPSSRP